VGSTYDAIVKDPTKDVLLEVYAPWCGYCQQLAPEYARLAGALAGVDSLVLAKVDKDDNEHADLDAVEVRSRCRGACSSAGGGGR
jgi:thiol-disulfide isomerase/thioredoxin